MTSLKPISLSVNFDKIPLYPSKRKQWVLWRHELVNGRWTKIPYQPNGYKAKSNDLSTWSSFEDCRKVYKTGTYDGIGFCFADGDGMVGIDLDQCYTIYGELELWAKEILSKFTNAYIEKSPSGEGLHIWCLGKKNGLRTASKWESPLKDKNEGIEVYDSSSIRYLTFTGVLIDD